MECKKLRRMLIRHGTLNLGTGETEPGRQEWVTRPCGVPLFTDKDKANGLCSGCLSGWTHPENYPAETK